jgi:hypothetical protein
MIIRLLMLLGLAHDVVVPNRRLAANSRAKRLATREFQNLPGH